MDLRKLLFVLPNLFTVSSIFCGFYALTLLLGDAQPWHLYQASLAILAAMFFDGFDGRVARLTKTQSAFGVELDSSADVLSFGAAPALLVYKWALQELGTVGLLVSFAFAAAGALRLARFNVLAQRSGDGGGGAFFVGLPIPIAASMLVSLIITHHLTHGGALGSRSVVPVASVVVLLSVLMVSTVRYPTFKKLQPSVPLVLGLLLAVATAVIIATQAHPAYALVAMFAIYLMVGLVDSGLWLRSQLLAWRSDDERP